MFLEDLDQLENRRLASLTEIKQKNLPVVMYGSAIYGSVVERFLNENAISVAARFVDVNYQPQAGDLYFRDVEEKFHKFCVVSGMMDFRRAFKAMDQRASKQVDGVYHFTLNPLYLDAVNHSFVKENADKLKAVYDMLSDDLSRQAYLGYIKAQISGNDQFLIDVCCPNQYFQEFMKLSNDDIFVDAGAYIGDTLADFLECAGGVCQKYYAFEPDAINFQKLERFVDEKRLPNVKLINCGLGSRQGVERFAQGVGQSSVSKICENGNVAVQIDTIDRSCQDASFIKMDIEGAELEALEGAQKTIRSNRPKLAICAYHKPSHLWEVPNYVKSLVPQYQVFFRHHKTFSTELVMYAVAS